jgi:hypothetical protein
MMIINFIIKIIINIFYKFDKLFFIIEIIVNITLFIPTLSYLWIIYLCKFDSSTQSPSIIPKVPTPIPDRYSAAGAPIPPAPIIKIFA